MAMYGCISPYMCILDMAPHMAIVDHVARAFIWTESIWKTLLLNGVLLLLVKPIICALSLIHGRHLLLNATFTRAVPSFFISSHNILSIATW
jgi:hypothetical protein